MGADRIDLLAEAMREYIDEQTDSDAFQQRVATAFYEDELDFEIVKQFVGPPTRPAPPLAKRRYRG